MNTHLERGVLLYQQDRHELAGEQLRLALAQEPDDAHAHALLALCLVECEKFAEATDETGQAIRLAPDYDFAHYAAAKVACARDQYEDALPAIQEAIRLDPSDADYRALLAGIHLDQRQWQEALAAAEAGLEQDAEHIGCTNLRAMALVKLGRRSEAGQTIDTALARNPDNATTHANQGWTCLDANDPQKALEHFREALRLDPESEWARQGLVEALKARHFLYSLVLRYFLWMGKLSPRAQWGVILGVFFGNRFLGALAKSSPELAPWVLPARIILFTAIVLTWTADPLFNLVLRLNKFGRLALSDEQRSASTWFGVCVAGALVSLALCAVFGSDSVFLTPAFVFGFLMVPVAGTFRAAAGGPRKLLGIWTLALALAGAAAIVTKVAAHLQSAPAESPLREASYAAFLIFLWGTVAFMWGANLIAHRRQHR